MIDLQRVAACVLIAVALPAAAESRRTPFTHFGTQPVLALRGDGDAATVEFGSRSDELVTRARLNLRYSYSPELAPGASHIRVSLNDDVVGLLPVTRADAGKTVARELDVDPRLVVGFNKLTLTLVASRGDGPPDAARAGMWAEVSGTSEWEIVVQALALADELAILPEPFFDRHDQRRVTVPFVFAARPSEATLRAAAVTASWLGKLARWRGARFPASLDAPAEGHAIAFAANDERPAFLAALPPATGPELRLATNPADGRSKLLLVLGRNGEDLKAAADALATGAKMSGPSVQVKRGEDAGPRAPYDAPEWVRLDRAVKLGDLIEWPQQLEATGQLPDLDPVRVDLRVPPDIAAWRGPGVPMVLKLQYTPGACVTDGQLDLSLNDEVVQSITLPIAPGAITETREIFLPGYRLRGRSELKFAFRFALKDEPQCREPRPGRAVVASDSSIDFSGFPHYARLPNLEHFAALGFPFTRVADLSQTVVVLPDNPAAADLEAMLSLMGRMGEATGHPVTRVRVAAPKDAAALAGADLLVIGSAPQQALLERWAGAMPVSISDMSRRASPPPMTRSAGIYDWLGWGAPPETGVASQVSFGGTGPVAAMFGFESPVTSGRSVVVVTAVVPDQLVRALEALEGDDTRRAIRGSAAFMVDGKVESVLMGPTYHVGFMPPWTGLGRWLVEHPLVLASALAFVALVAFYIVTRIRRRLRAWRIRARA